MKQKGLKYKYSIASVQDDLEFEMETLVIYREFILHYLDNPKWKTTLEEDQALFKHLK